MNMSITPKMCPIVTPAFYTSMNHPQVTRDWFVFCRTYVLFDSASFTQHYLRITQIVLCINISFFLHCQGFHDLDVAQFVSLFALSWTSRSLPVRLIISIQLTSCPPDNEHAGHFLFAWLWTPGPLPIHLIMKSGPLPTLLIMYIRVTSWLRLLQMHLLWALV